MNSFNGLSSNTPKPQSSLQLDATTRQGILARNQARLLSSLGVTGGDGFDSGGGLNPLKGLYSAAASAFLKNKQGRGVSDTAGFQSTVVEKSVNAARTLASKATASSMAADQATLKTTGPSKGSDYRKYAWDGKNGPTGKDNVLADKDANDLPDAEEAEPVAPVSAEPVAESARDASEVLARMTTLISDNEGSLNDNGDGSVEFKLLDIGGTLRLDGDRVTGSVETEAGKFAFSVNKSGVVEIDASEGDSSSAEYEQVKGLLTGSLAGVRRKSESAPAAPVETPPTEPAQAPAPEPAQAQAAAPAPAPAPEPEPAVNPDSMAALLSANQSSVNALLVSGSKSDKARFNARLMIDDIKNAGGNVRVKDDKTLTIAFNGQAGEIKLGGDRVTGSLGSGDSKISFVIRNDGRMSISGDDKSAQAVSNSKALRTALGVSSSGTGFRSYDVAKFNREGLLGSLFSALF